MKVFLSWSGTRSKFIAEALRWWLPRVIQSVRPWMSDEDISAGSRWLSNVSSELSEAKLGIICVTPENKNNPWLLFEAGALSKVIDQAHVCPFLIDLTPGQLAGPLSQFQANQVSFRRLSRVPKVDSQPFLIPFVCRPRSNSLRTSSAGLLPRRRPVNTGRPCRSPRRSRRRPTRALSRRRSHGKPLRNLLSGSGRSGSRRRSLRRGR
jgi:TIR domain